MADKTFSVMVNKDGVLDYPSNFITANNLAKFGSEVVGTFKEIKFGSEETGASTIILNLTEDENLGYNTDLIISNKNLSGYTNSIILNFSENNNDPTVGPGLEMEYNTVLGTADITLSTTSSTHSGGSIYLNSCNTSITCDQFTVTAPSASLPANTTIGGSKPATFGSDVDGTLKSLNTTKVSSLTGTEYIEFTPPDEFGNGSVVSFYTDDGASIQKRFEINAMLARLDIPYGNIELIGSDGISLDSNSISLNSGDIELIGGGVISLNSAGISLNSSDISLNSSGTAKIYSQQEDGNGSVDIGISYTYFDPNAVSDITIKNNILIDKDKITATAPLVELPANTTIGGKTVATGAPSNMVTTDTTQTITGNKTFTGDVNLSYDMIRTDADLGDCSISAYSIEVSASSSLNINSSSVSIENALKIESNEYPIEQEQYASAIKFLKPQQLRIYDTVNKVWTNTYKFVYLAQDENGSVSLAIADEAPINSAIS